VPRVTTQLRTAWCNRTGMGLPSCRFYSLTNARSDLGHDIENHRRPKFLTRYELSRTAVAY